MNYNLRNIRSPDGQFELFSSIYSDREELYPVDSVIDNSNQEIKISTAEFVKITQNFITQDNLLRQKKINKIKEKRKKIRFLKRRGRREIGNTV